MTESIANTIIPRTIEDEMKTSYIDYAMSVIVSRALPDVRDGLKPVHRRILFGMQDLGMTHEKPHKKSARVVGEVLGKYHPHGDTSVYDAMVRMAQDFASRYPLVDGHGNFGSIDGDAPAAMRYTEVRMSALAALMLEDIRKETVDLTPNFDESLKEPVVLPARFPNLLANGSSGIAVGMATNIPPHNLGELIDAIVVILDKHDLTDDELFRHVKGPDFPTGGIIRGRDGIRQAYLTGRGSIRVRGRAEIELASNGKPQITITEIPYQLSKARLVEKIAELVRQKRLDGVTDLRDESDRRGLRVVVELRRDVNPQVVLNRLYKFTGLEQTFGINLLALVDGYPRTMSLREMVDHYIEHQRDVVTRRTRYDLARAEERAHILEGLRIALDHIDEVISLIRSSPTVDEARTRLMTRFALSERQAQAILEMRLQRLAALERQKIEDEYAEVSRAIEEYRRILASREALDGIIRTELLAVRDKYADPRRTQITSDTDDLDVEDLIADEDIIITLSVDGFIKRQSLTAFRRQLRGGRGVQAATLREGDEIRHLLTTTTHRQILLFTSTGRAYRTKAHLVPEQGRHARGVPLANVIALSLDERITGLLPVPPTATDNEDTQIIMATRCGVIKRVSYSSFRNVTKAGLKAINLDEGDEVAAAVLIAGEQDLMLATRLGRATRFSSTELRAMGRAARGVRGIRLAPNDEVIALVPVTPGEDLLVVTANGYGKRTRFGLFRPMRRGGQGVTALRADRRSGPVAVVASTRPKSDVILLSLSGVIIRIKASQAKMQGRQARGVTLMRLEPDDVIVAGLPVVPGDADT